MQEADDIDEDTYFRELRLAESFRLFVMNFVCGAGCQLSREEVRSCLARQPTCPVSSCAM